MSNQNRKRNNHFRQNKRRCLSELEEMNLLPVFQEAEENLPNCVKIHL